MSSKLKVFLKILLPLLVVAVGGWAGLAIIGAREEPEKVESVAPPPLVQVIEAKPQAIRLKVRTEGTVAPRRESEMVPEVSGRVVWISDSLISGGYFEKGEELLRVDAREYELAVVNAAAAVAQTKLRLATEREEAEVARREWESLGEGEPTALTLREPQIADAEAAVAAAGAALEQKKYDLERTVLHAPYDGRVRQKSVDIGQFVSRGAPIARIYSVDYAEVRLPIPDSEIGFVDLPFTYRGTERTKSRPGPKVLLRARFGGQDFTWAGRIVRTEAEIDPQSRMMHVITQVEKPYDLSSQGGHRRPPLAVGMYVEAEIEGRPVAGVTPVPRAALRTGDQVLVVEEGERLRFRSVEILRADGDQVLVRSGLAAGDRICISPLETAVNGMAVRVKDSETEVSMSGP